MGPKNWISDSISERIWRDGMDFIPASKNWGYFSPINLAGILNCWDVMSCKATFTAFFLPTYHPIAKWRNFQARGNHLHKNVCAFCGHFPYHDRLRALRTINFRRPLGG